MRTPGYGITPDRFVRVAHLLPRQCGNVAVDNHTFVNALLWMCRTGAPWRDLPECYGKWVTVYQRFDRWSGNGATGCLSTALQEERIIGVEIRVPAMCVCSIESGPCERVDVFHVSGRFWSTSACGEKRTPARPAWTSFPS